MRVVATVVGVLLVLAGTVWVLQGLDVAFAPTSFMTDNRRWVVFGALAIVAGVLTIIWANRGRVRRTDPER